MPSSHIRPRVRSKKKPPSKLDESATKDEGDWVSLEEMLAQTRKRMDEVLPPSQSLPAAIPSSTVKSTSTIPLKDLVRKVENLSMSSDSTKDSRTGKQPASILKQPKYSSSTTTTESEKAAARNDSETTGEKDSTKTIPTKQNRSLPLKDSVVERRNPKPQTLPTTHEAESSSAFQVEGYTPKTTPTCIPQPQTADIEEKAEENEPLVVSSITELLDEANQSHSSSTATKPPTSEELKNAKVIEADLSFSVMSPQDFDALKKNREDESKEEENQQPVSSPVTPFAGHFDIFGEDEDHSSQNDGKSSKVTGDDDDDDGGSILFDEYIEETLPSPEPRAFMRIWWALAAWITPQAVGFATTGNPPRSNPPKSDLEASRCAGLMTLVNMHLNKCVDEVGGIAPKHSIRTVRERLAVFLQTFTFSRPMVQFDTRLMKATTCVLLAICWPNEVDVTSTLPKSVRDVGILQEEYRYLAQSALKSLAQV